MQTNSLNKGFLWAVILFSFFSFTSQTSQAFGSSRQERKQQALEESGKVKSVKGGQTITVSLSYDEAYEKLLNFLKRRDEGIDSANRETGQIASSISIEGGWKQTGTRTQFTLIKEADKSTSIKIQVVEMSRFKALVTEPWDDPILNEEKTKVMTEEVKAYLTVQ